MIDGEQIVARLLDPPRDPIAMLRAHYVQRLQHHQRQRPLPDVSFRTHMGHPQECASRFVGKQQESD